MVSNSVVVFVVREGNPKGIDGWDDLVGGDVEVVTPNPFTSGGAKWNLMAAYGAQLEQGKTRGRGGSVSRRPARRTRRCRTRARGRPCRRSPPARATSCSPTRTRRSSPIDQGQPIEYVVPDETILIENPAAVTVDSGPAAAAWLEFVQSPEAQQVFGEHGYRPVDPDVAAAVRLPAAGWPLHDRRPRRLERGRTRRSSIARTASSPESSRSSVSPPTTRRSMSSQRRIRSRPTPARGRPRAGVMTLGISTVYLSADRPDPDRRRRREAFERRLGQLLERRSRAPRPSRR